MSLGNHTIFIKKDGTAWGCGYNSFGQLGENTTGNRSSLTKCLISDVKFSVCGSNHTLFFKNDGTIYGCGNNGSSKLGIPSGSIITTPTKVEIDDVKYIDCGNSYTMFLKNDGTVWGCGENNYGQLGLGNTVSATTITKIPISNVKFIACGDYHTIFIKHDGSIFGCGRNNDGQLGLDNNVGNVTTPTQINVQDVKTVSCGGTHTLFLKNNGTLWSCGNNSNGQLGLGITTSPIATISKINITNVKFIYSGSNHTIIIKEDGSVYGWGLNGTGQLGLGHTSKMLSPTKINIDDVKFISCGSAHTIFVKNDGTAYCCGFNYYGQLGLGATSNTNSTITKINVTDIIGSCGTYIIEQFYIIKSEGKYYYINNNELLSVNEPITSEIIKSLGVSLEEINKNIDIMPDKFSIISNSEFGVKVKGIKSKNGLIVANNDFSTNVTSNVDYFKCVFDLSENSSIKIAVSIDGGSTWLSHDGSDFIDLNINIPLKDFSTLSSEELINWNTSKDTILSKGIDVKILDSINFNSLTFDKIRFAYAIQINDVDDVAINKSLIWQFDGKGYMEKMKESEYNLRMYSNNVVISPTSDYEIIKVNILISN